MRERERYSGAVGDYERKTRRGKFGITIWVACYLFGLGLSKTIQISNGLNQIRKILNFKRIETQLWFEFGPR